MAIQLTGHNSMASLAAQELNETDDKVELWEYEVFYEMSPIVVRAPPVVPIPMTSMMPGEEKNWKEQTMTHSMTKKPFKGFSGTDIHYEEFNMKMRVLRELNSNRERLIQQTIEKWRNGQGYITFLSDKDFDESMEVNDVSSHNETDDLFMSIDESHGPSISVDQTGPTDDNMTEWAEYCASNGIPWDSFAEIIRAHSQMKPREPTLFERIYHASADYETLRENDSIDGGECSSAAQNGDDSIEQNMQQWKEYYRSYGFPWNSVSETNRTQTHAQRGTAKPTSSRENEGECSSAARNDDDSIEGNMNQWKEYYKSNGFPWNSVSETDKTQTRSQRGTSKPMSFVSSYNVVNDNENLGKNNSNEERPCSSATQNESNSYEEGEYSSAPQNEYNLNGVPSSSSSAPQNNDTSTEESRINMLTEFLKDYRQLVSVLRGETKPEWLDEIMFNYYWTQAYKMEQGARMFSAITRLEEKKIAFYKELVQLYKDLESTNNK